MASTVSTSTSFHRMNRNEIRFSPDQRALVARALGEAEERTARYYCIPPYHWQNLPYDLLTRGDRDWRPLPDSTLAEVLYMQRAAPVTRAGKCSELYRIQLNDESILRAANRENVQSSLYPLLVYVLTHEMVHLVRLSSILERGIFSTAPCDSEEDRVHRISRQILAGAGHPGLVQVLNRFCVARA